MSAAVNFDHKRYAPDAATDRLSAPPTQTTICLEQSRAAALFASASAARLRWLEDAVAAAEERALRFRDARDEEAMLLMRRPLTTEQTYARFGLLLGAIAPAAIFARFIMAFSHDLDAGSLIAIVFCLTMN